MWDPTFYPITGILMAENLQTWVSSTIFRIKSPLKGKLCISRDLTSAMLVLNPGIPGGLHIMHLWTHEKQHWIQGGSHHAILIRVIWKICSGSINTWLSRTGVSLHDPYLEKNYMLWTCKAVWGIRTIKNAYVIHENKSLQEQKYKLFITGYGKWVGQVIGMIWKKCLHHAWGRVAADVISTSHLCLMPHCR